MTRKSCSWPGRDASLTRPLIGQHSHPLDRVAAAFKLRSFLITKLAKRNPVHPAADGGPACAEAARAGRRPQSVRVCARITSDFGGSAAGPDARRKGGSVSPRDTRPTEQRSRWPGAAPPLRAGGLGRAGCVAPRSQTARVCSLVAPCQPAQSPPAKSELIFAQTLWIRKCQIIRCDPIAASSPLGGYGLTRGRSVYLRKATRARNGTSDSAKNSGPPR